MSRSTRKPIYKDGGKKHKQAANRTCRSRNNQRVRIGLEPLPDKVIVNDYNVCDYVFMLEEKDRDYKKAKRK